MTNSKAHARIWPPAPGEATSTVYVMFKLASASAPPGTEVNFSINPFTGKVRFNNQVNYWDSTASATELTYNATDHAWLRFREEGETLYWETSPNGVDWTVRRSLTTPAWLAAATDVSLAVEAHRESGTADFAEVDNVNTTA
ncbi:hypothetical protein ACR6C2_16860 [Streptomyces sp. INA 01156]